MKDRVFLRLAGQLLGISLGLCPQEIPRKSLPAFGKCRKSFLFYLDYSIPFSFVSTECFLLYLKVITSQWTSGLQLLQSIILSYSEIRGEGVNENFSRNGPLCLGKQSHKKNSPIWKLSKMP